MVSFPPLYGQLRQMDRKNNSLNNYGDKHPVSDSSDNVSNSTFFKDKDISTLYSNTPERVARKNHILNFIKKHPGTTSYTISKEMGISYSQIVQAVRDMEYLGFIFIRVVIVNGRPNKKLYAGVEE